MPIKNADMRQQEEKLKLAEEIAELSVQLTYQEKLEVLRACGIHEDTLTRYKAEVKKIPTARKMIAEMKRVLAARGESVAA